jgi:hypothetical protein
LELQISEIKIKTYIAFKKFIFPIFRQEMWISKKIPLLFLTLVLFFGAHDLFPQNGFYFPKENREKNKLRFEFVKNLMVIPVSLNGVELSFLLDTGVEKTILFSLEDKDSLMLKNAVSIEVRGLGQGKAATAFRSEGNQIKIGKAINDSISLYVVFDKKMNFSPMLGIPVHGIIGSDFFRDFIVEVDYEREFIRFYEASTYNIKCRKCGVSKLYFFDKNPYLKTKIKVSGIRSEAMLLMDSGLGGALWLYPDENVRVPEKNFEDYLGLGLSGSIYGKRGKIESFSFGIYEFHDITTAFPDSSVVAVNVRKEILKDGIVGAEILKRFDLVIDYPNKLLYYRPNRFFDEPFHYNMSGLTFRYNGLRVVKDFEYVNVGRLGNATELDVENNFKPTSYKVKFRIEPAMEIAEIRPNSPAERVGLKKGDVLVKLNGKGAHQYDLNELTELFCSEEGKKIKITVERDGVEHSMEFRLEEMF